MWYGRHLLRLRLFLLLFGVMLLGGLLPFAQAEVIRSHAIAMHGQPKYAADFKHFDYVNADAPKGGSLRQADQGTFNSFNPWIDKGSAITPSSIETLLVSSADEAFTKYCLLCEQIEYPSDRSWIIFHLRANARWHDGKPITPQDVVWSFNMLKEKGRPFYRFYYADVVNVEVVGEHAVRFQFKNAGNRELPLIIGDLPILPKHYWQKHDFSKTTLTPPLGSGPYKIKRFEAGRYLERERVADYWGRNLPIKRGIDNFDLIRTDFFRDRIPIRLALKAGEIDYYAENTAKSWATEFDIPSVQSGWLIKERIEHSAPQGMQAYVMNLRRPKFQERKIREAIALAFDFNWTNKKMFYNQYIRSTSFFSNSELASSGIAEGDELALLQNYRDQLPAELFSEAFDVAETDGRGWHRGNLLKALSLIKQTDWRIDNGKLVNAKNQPLVIEVLLYSSVFERLILPYASNLKRLGIDMKIRVVDSGQYVNRLRAFDFDMIVSSWGQSETPGNEQRGFWGCAAAAQPGSRNTAGICHPVIEELIEKIIIAPSRERLITVTRALDRVLLWQHFVVPNWHLPADRVLWWNKFSRPSMPLRNGVSISRWWLDDEKAVRLAQAREAGEIATRSVANADTDNLNKDTRSLSWSFGLLLGLLLIGGLLIKRTLKRTEQTKTS